MIGEFNPTYSTNNIWVDEEFDYCLTLLLEAIQASIASKVDANHTHNGYAPISHSHTEYALSSHNHNNLYSSINHNHNDLYAPSAHTHTDITVEAIADIATLAEVQTFLGS